MDWSIVYSCSIPIPGIGSRSTVTLTRIKQLLNKRAETRSDGGLANKPSSCPLEAAVTPPTQQQGE
ncbi:hypothetical protein AMELA_G00215190 [Ameiurus melas]|uniref:Uncharacterized protein n=1 Tax=Ameiurus melas TaxID=219545 RepID=A0A7J6A135_AMEME|nr:hypothetical protein AMELA_G00215190 [Ameiurus melas]